MRIVLTVVIAAVFGVLTLDFNCPSMQAQECSGIVSEHRSSVVYLKVLRVVKNTGAVRTFEATGFLVTGTGVVFTNRHVVATGDSTDEVKISGAVGSRAKDPQPMHVLGVSEQTDIAAIQFNDTGGRWNPVIVGNPWILGVGHQLCSMSFPLDVEFLSARGSLTGKGAPGGWWYSDMPSNPGDSGAPVFDAATGRVVAIKVGDRDDAKNVSFIIPINLANSLLRTHAGIGVPDEHEDPYLQVRNFLSFYITGPNYTSHSDCCLVSKAWQFTGIYNCKLSYTFHIEEFHTDGKPDTSESYEYVIDLSALGPKSVQLERVYDGLFRQITILDPSGRAISISKIAPTQSTFTAKRTGITTNASDVDLLPFLENFEHLRQSCAVK